MMDQAVQKGYDELYRNHEADHTALFNRVRLQLNPDISSPNLPTYQRLANYKKGTPDYQLEQLYYQFGRYLLIASSRPGNMPPICKVCGTTIWTVPGEWIITITLISR